VKPAVCIEARSKRHAEDACVSQLEFFNEELRHRIDDRVLNALELPQRRDGNHLLASSDHRLMFRPYIAATPPLLDNRFAAGNTLHQKNAC
jgi:hypothetical protein